MARIVRTLGLIAVVFSLQQPVAIRAAAPAWPEVTLMTNFDYGRFGSAVSVRGDVMAVGSAPLLDAHNIIVEPGGVTVYRKVSNKWVKEQEWENTRGVGHIAIEGDLLALTGLDNVFEIFERVAGVWTRVYQKSADYPVVAVSGTTVVLSETVGTHAGVAIYGRQAGAWVVQQQISCGYCGSIEIDGDTLVLGDLFANVRVYVRHDNTWTLQTTITQTAGRENGVAIHGDRLAISSYSARFTIYERVNSTWTKTADFVAGAGGSGHQVALDGDQLIATYLDNPAATYGPIVIEAYDLEKGRWTLVAKGETPTQGYSINGDVDVDNGCAFLASSEGFFVRRYCDILADAGPDFEVAATTLGRATVTLTGEVKRAAPVHPQWTFNGSVVDGLTATVTVPPGVWTATFSDSNYGVSDDITFSVTLPMAAGAQGGAGAAGSTGATGQIGPTGATGATGTAGVAGNVVDGVAGATGPTGATGATGPNGETGATGDPGSMGAIGPTGPTGATGNQGPAGDRGPDGAAGPDGAIGAKGTTGTVGPRGFTGAPGSAGSNGNSGAQGPVGAPGPTGPQGPAGAIGATGAAGERGDKGQAGNQGANGAEGAEGAKGDLGSSGPRGEPGDQGAKGADGATGANGVEGVGGARGTAGAIGAAGAVGSPGLIGVKGDAGEFGTAGPTGSSGVKGAPGDQGPSGTRGTTGPPEPTNLHSIVFMLEGDRPPAGYVAVGAFWEERIDADGPGGQHPRRLRIVMWQKP